MNPILTHYEEMIKEFETRCLTVGLVGADRKKVWCVATDGEELHKCFTETFLSFLDKEIERGERMKQKNHESWCSRSSVMECNCGVDNFSSALDQFLLPLKEARAKLTANK